MSIHVSFGKYDKLFSNPITLQISGEGKLEGSITLLHIPIGQVVGTISPSGTLVGRVTTPLFTVGTVSGALTADAGSGTYQSVAGAGTWSSRKQ
ncbi:MAG TPA: hypothetical protein VMG34_10920 [Bacteroidota bacterium]|nr:hypothetical protein [Bacteroidota bacterium]